MASEAKPGGVRGRDACASVTAATPHLTSPFQGEGFRPALELWAVVALYDDQIEFGFAVAQLFCRLIAGRAVAGECGVVAREFQHHGAAARFSLWRFLLAAADQIACAEFAQRRLIRHHVGVV